MGYILKPICTCIICIFFLYVAKGQFAFSYDGPDTLFVGDDCTAILDWGHPGTPQVFPTMPGQVIISWTIFSISGGYMIGDSVPAGETVTVFYQARDNMGHISLFGFNLPVVDGTPPTFDAESLPDDVTIGCGGDIPVEEINYSDNCDQVFDIVLTIQDSGIPDACAGGELTRTYTLTDAAGNMASYVQHITVEPDTSDPVITGIPADGTAPCGDIMTQYNSWIAVQRTAFMADDFGCGILSLSDNAPSASALVGFCGELEVSFFAEDSCGNISSVIASFVVTNNTPPTITTPAMDASASCTGGDPQSALQTWLANQGGAEATDDCSVITWSSAPVSPSITDVCNGALVVTFTADDGCGNTASTTADFFIQDTTGPMITAEAQSVVINCSTTNFEAEMAMWLSSHGNASATDFCTEEDSLEVQFVLDGNTLDSAGVFAAFQDSITNGTCVDGVIINGFLWNNVLAMIDLEFVFVDNCGNTSGTTGVFAIRDVNGPVWETPPQDSILTCAGGDIEALFADWYETAGFANGTDDCGNVNYVGNPTFAEALAQLNEGLDTACASGITVEVAFQLNDFCGNANPTIESAVFGIAENTGPVLIQSPEDIDFNCEADAESALHAWLDSLAGAQVQQACGDIHWMFSWVVDGDTLTGLPGTGPYPNIELVGCNTGLEVSFMATDICSNSVTAVAEFRFTDTIAPVLVVDSMVTIACDSLEFISISASDNCTENPVITFSDINPQGDTSQCLDGMILRTWRAEDACGNVVTAVQVINTSDTEAPTFIAPSDTVIFCMNTGEIDPGEPVAVGDNCDPDPVVTFEDVLTGDDCAQTITRRWMVADACGNVQTAIQEISLIDTLAPSFTVAPIDLVLECNGTTDLESAFDQWLTNGAGATLVDNCGSAQYFFAVPGSYQIADTSTWPGIQPGFPMLECGDDTLATLPVDMVYSDACGNADVVTLNMLVMDTSPPLVEQCPTDTTIVLESGICETRVEVSPPRVFDGCRAILDTVQLDITLPVTSAVPGDSSVTVDTLTFSFNVPGPPAFAFLPATLTLVLSGVDAEIATEHFVVYGEGNTLIGISNNADLECDTVETAFIISSEQFNFWAGDGIIEFVLVPNTITGDTSSINDICPGASVTAEIFAIQGVQEELTFEYSIDTLPRVSMDSLAVVMAQLYAGVHEFTWHIKDCAGNESTCVSEITILDSDVPTIACPGDISIILNDETGCSLPITLNAPEANDLCGIDAATARYRIEGDTIIGDTYFNGTDSIVVLLTAGEYAIQYRIQDPSGNTGSCSFGITIIDPERPEAVCQPATAFVHPSGQIPVQIDPALIDGGSSDNCRIDTMLVVPSAFPCDSAGTGQIVEFIVIDVSGNADTCLAVLQIEVAALEPTYETGICAMDTLRLFANVPDTQEYPYSFDWTGPNGFSSSVENPIIPDINLSYAGIYNVEVTGSGSCTTSGSIAVVIEEEHIPDFSVESPLVCEGDAVVLLASEYAQDVTYRWYRGTAPGGLHLGTTTEPAFTDFPPLTGQYAYYVIVETVDCSTNPSDQVQVEVVSMPASSVQTPFIEVCEGAGFTLGTEISGPGIDYQWTGPNGFNSTEQFPGITDADGADAGTYSLVIVLGSCVSEPATTDVVVAPRPDMPVIDGDPVYCEGGSLTLMANNVVDADQYIWQNPQMDAISTPGNALILNNIDPDVEGTWTVVALLGNCPSDTSNPFIVQLERTLLIEATNDGPVCDGNGDSVMLFVEILPGMSYVWSGPDGFMSTEPNPTVPGILGTYTVTVTSENGCMTSASTEIVEGSPPAITAISNTSGVCADSMQSLSFAVTLFPPDTGAYEYIWTGPNGFVSSEIHPVIPGLTTDLNGTYTLVVSFGNCTSEPASTEVQVLNAPVTPKVDGVLEYCSGQTILLTAPSYSGDSVVYIWNTPTGTQQIFNDSILTVEEITVVHGGVYSVVVSVDGCDSQQSDPVMISVAQIIEQPVVVAPASVCTGDSLQLMTSFVPNGTYQWTGPSGFSSELQNPVVYPTSSDAAGEYYVSVQVGMCVSDLSDAAMVSVLPLPTSPVAESFEGSVCLGDPSSIMLCIEESTLTPGALYTWSFQGNPLIVPTDMRCITISDFSVFAGGTNSIEVVAGLNGCHSTGSGSVSVSMYDFPEESPDAGPDAVYCADDDISLNAQSPSVGSGMWSSPGGVTFADISDPFSTIDNLQEGENVLIWSLDFETCLDYARDTVVITVEQTPQANRDSVLVPFGEAIDINVLLNDFVAGDYILSLMPGGPLRGNVLNKGAGILTYDPNLGYVGPDRITYRLCSAVCPEQCTTADLILQVGDETDCFIPSIFTPNGDGTNDRLIIPCLETAQFPQNRIMIFNEWGDAVYEARPYLNDWTGTRNGKDLPVATYFYIIDFGDGRPVQSGFLILER